MTSSQFLSAWYLKLMLHINHIQFVQVSPFCYQLAKFKLEKLNMTEKTLPIVKNRFFLVHSLTLLQANVWI